MTWFSEIRESKTFKLIADISVLHWLLTVVPASVPAIGAAMHGRPIETVMLYFLVACAAILASLHYGEFFWNRLIKKAGVTSRALPLEGKSLPQKYWPISIPAIAFSAICLFWVANKYLMFRVPSSTPVVNSPVPQTKSEPQKDTQTNKEKEQETKPPKKDTLKPKPEPTKNPESPAVTPSPSPPTNQRDCNSVQNGGSGNIAAPCGEVNIVAPTGRLLSEDNFKSLVGHLKEIKKDTVAIVLFEPVTGEADKLGGQLQAAFKEADWSDVPGYTRDISNDHRMNSYGAGSRVTNEPAGMHCTGDSEQAQALIKLLSTVGLKCVYSASNLYPVPNPAPTLTIYIGRDLSQ